MKTCEENRTVLAQNWTALPRVTFRHRSLNSLTPLARDVIYGWPPTCAKPLQRRHSQSLESSSANVSGCLFCRLLRFQQVLTLNTRWFKHDRDYLCVNKSQFVPVIFELPYILQSVRPYIQGLISNSRPVKGNSQSSVQKMPGAQPLEVKWP
jgi:hypothetical protein